MLPAIKHKKSPSLFSLLQHVLAMKMKDKQIM